MNWGEIFRYEDGKLFRIKFMGSRGVAGSEVGTIDNHGYLCFIMNKGRFKNHRVIWEMFNGEIPKGMHIDHINHIRDDNRIENLRVVSRVDNQRNQSLRSDNSSGNVGVSFMKKLGKWEAYIYLGGKKIKIGYYSNIDDAIKARKSASEEYGFHKNHGEKK